MFRDARHWKAALGFSPPSGSGVQAQAAAQGFLSTVIPRWRRMGDRERPAVKPRARRVHVFLGDEGGESDVTS